MQLLEEVQGSDFEVACETSFGLALPPVLYNGSDIYDQYLNRLSQSESRHDPWTAAAKWYLVNAVLARSLIGRDSLSPQGP